jgi:hypothetical protein
LDALQPKTALKESAAGFESFEIIKRMRIEFQAARRESKLGVRLGDENQNQKD